MAHQDYLGTFGKGQFDRFVSWATPQLKSIDSRIQHLEAEIYRIGKVVMTYDRGVPLGLTADPSDSYMAKLLACYEIRGGNPFVDLRTRDYQDPIYLERGDETMSAHSMSNGESVPQKGLADSPSAKAMQSARAWLETTLDGRFGRLERKIRRALDYQDQLTLEIKELRVVKNDYQDRLDTINQLLADPNYRAATLDPDPLGLLKDAPFSSYDVAVGVTGNTREATMPQRQQGGIVSSGKK